MHLVFNTRRRPAPFVCLAFLYMKPSTCTSPVGDGSAAGCASAPLGAEADDEAEDAEQRGPRPKESERTSRPPPPARGTQARYEETPLTALRRLPLEEAHLFTAAAVKIRRSQP